MNNIKQRILENKYKKAKEIYIVCLWNKYGILPAKLYRYDKNGEPLTIQWTDHNGLSEEYYIAPWHFESAGAICYFTNINIAKYIVGRLNKNE